MKNKTLKKQKYEAPTIECIGLDNEISLALASTPPEGPEETRNLSPEYFNNDPYRIS